MRSDPGPRPQLKWLPVDRLAVDPRYQRSIESERSRALIRRIAENFRWSAFQAILVTVAPGGGHLVLDGQHRVEGARGAGLKDVPAVIVEALSLEEQAAAFVQANLQRVAVTPFALFHARLAAGDDGARQVDRLCRGAGISIPRYPIPADKLEPGQTLALASIFRLVKSLGPRDARVALEAIAEPYGATPGAIRAPILRAVECLLQPIGGSDERGARAAAIRAFLGRTPPDTLYAKASRRQLERGGTAADNIAAIIKSGIAVAERPAGIAGSSIRAPSRAELMGAR